MHVIVVGAGEVGSYVAELLARGANDVAVVERDPGRLRDLESRLDVLAIQGSGSHPHVLKAAGVDKADLLVAVSSDDEANLIASLLAKQAGVARTIVRLQADCLRSREAAALRDAIGADLVIDPDEETAEEIFQLLAAPGATDIALLGNGEVLVIGSILDEDAPICGRRLSDIAAQYEPDWDFLVAALTRDGETLIPRADHTLAPDDHLWIVAKRKARTDVLRLLGHDPTNLRRVMLLGGGRTAELVAHRLLRRNLSVTIVERRPERARELAERLERALVLNGDITDAELLAAEDVGDHDAVIALTGHDDANILACLYAKRLGARETIAVLHRLSLRSLLEEVGIDAALSPRTATANGVLRFVHGGVAAVATFLAGDFEVVEVEVAAGSRAANRAIAELGLPRNMLIGAFVRDGKAQIGRGHSVLRERDHVVMVAPPESVDALGQFFG